jgi:crossover junction endodeoxyribonuclease RuvC
MVRILGVDPGLAHTGWGLVDAEGNRVSYIASGTIHTKPADGMPQRLQMLCEGLSEAVKRFHPQEAAIEETFVNKNAQSSLKLGHARGALMVSLSLAGLPVAEYAARVVKKTVTGVGAAEKEQVQAMVRHLLPGSRADSADSADALAVALCHAYHATANRLKERVAK